MEDGFYVTLPCTKKEACINSLLLSLTCARKYSPLYLQPVVICYTACAKLVHVSLDNQLQNNCKKILTLHSLNTRSIHIYKIHIKKIRPTYIV
jgi:hypothetical protein